MYAVEIKILIFFIFVLSLLAIDYTLKSISEEKYQIQLDYKKSFWNVIYVLIKYIILTIALFLMKLIVSFEI